MKKLRILWLSNKMQTDSGNIGTGSWLDAMGQGLVHSGKIELGNIAFGNVVKFTKQDLGPIQQWIVPSSTKPHPNDGLPPMSIVSEICKTVDNFSPDLVQVWGTESFWGLLTARGLIQQSAILEMQGVIRAIARVYQGGLTFREQLACVGLKEILRGSTIFQGHKRFQNWGTFEKEIIAGHHFIITQSAWLKAQVQAMNKSCRIFHNDFPLLDSFYYAEPWQSPENDKIFCSTSYPSPFKGLHVAIRAVAILRDRFPNIQLHIAGAYPKKGIRQDGFVAWLVHEANRLGVNKNLFWLGPLTVGDIIKELQTCAVTLLPTYIEGYCLALAEAMKIGAPTVVSFTGGTSYLARDNETALFFSPGDEAMCAFQLERLLLDRELRERLSILSRRKALVRNDRNQIIQQQMNIYRQVLETTKKNDN